MPVLVRDLDYVDIEILYVNVGNDEGGTYPNSNVFQASKSQRNWFCHLECSYVMKYGQKCLKKILAEQPHSQQHAGRLQHFTLSTFLFDG